MNFLFIPLPSRPFFQFLEGGGIVVPRTLGEGGGGVMPSMPRPLNLPGFKFDVRYAQKETKYNFLGSGSII